MPFTMTPVCLVLPAFNEEVTLERLLSRLIGMPNLRVCVVDDGSTDATARVAESFQDRLTLELHRHPENQGLAAAIRSGLDLALRNVGPETVIITMDADDTHPPALMHEMTERIVRGGEDLVIASRYQPGARIHGLSRRRRLLSSAASLIFQTLIAVPGVRDYTCGYRAYRGSFLRQVWDEHGDKLRADTGFTCMVELLLLCSLYGPVVSEVPLELGYDRKVGASKMRVWRTLRHTFPLLLHYFWRRLTSRLRPAQRKPSRESGTPAASQAGS